MRLFQFFVSFHIQSDKLSREMELWQKSWIPRVPRVVPLIATAAPGVGREM